MNPRRVKIPSVLAKQMRPAFSQINSLFEAIDLNLHEVFGIVSAPAIPIDRLSARLQRWRENPEALSQWIGYLVRRNQLEADGLGALVERLHDGRIAADAALDHFENAYYESLIRDAFERHPELRGFAGLTHEKRIEEFRKLDATRIELARCEVMTAHHDDIPRGVGGEMRIVRQEVEKKRRHKPIRQLLKEAAAVQAIKPVFMMSPISVAQYLEPGSLTFDLLLVDEASQVSPVDALGAMARARQVVVVGDSKQLPPTRFFAKMLDDDSSPDDADDAFNAGDLDSILGLCVAKGLPQRMLHWHYRSRHHSLIAVSNCEFYENHLSCAQPHHDHRFTGSTFDSSGWRGRSRWNPNEPG
jgi:hypothetical protein